MNRRLFLRSPLALPFASRPRPSDYHWLSLITEKPVPPKFTFWQRVTCRYHCDDPRGPCYGETTFFIGRITGLTFATKGFAINEATWGKGGRWIYAVLWVSFPRPELWSTRLLKNGWWRMS